MQRLLSPMERAAGGRRGRRSAGTAGHAEPDSVAEQDAPAQPDDRDLQLQRVFKALADPTRRRILDLLKGRPLTTGAMCDEFPALSRFAVMKHLKVLTRANLVVVRRSGRERFNYLNHVPIRMVYERWMGPYAELWSSTLLRLRDHVERRHDPDPTKQDPRH